MNNDVYIERWEQAKRVLENMTPHEREKHFDMSDWGSQTECGTVACLAGHCSLDAWFREEGFESKFEMGGRRVPFLSFTGYEPEDFFGLRGYHFVFMRTSKKYDEVLQLVQQQIDYLKTGGDPHATKFDYETVDDVVFRNNYLGDGDDD